MIDVTVSVIIPVYNTEKYLDYTLASVYAQTWENLEIILINDGSSDGSLGICKKWENKDKRIRFFNNIHQGQGTQREFGLSKVTGEYVMFLDSDDYWEPCTVECVVRYMSSLKADVCFFSEKHIHGNGNVLEIMPSFHVDGTISIRDHIEILGMISPTLWNKCFSAKLIKNSKLHMENVLCEDMLFLAQLLQSAKKICTLNMCLYNYRSERLNNLSMIPDGYYSIVTTVDMLNEHYKKKEWEKYWRQLLQLSIYMFRERLIRIQSSGFVQSEIKEEYEILRHKYIATLDRWYSKKVDIGILQSNFVVDGSDALENMLKEISIEGCIPYRHLSDDIDYIVIDLLDFAKEMLQGVDIKNEFERKLELWKNMVGTIDNLRLIVVRNFLFEYYGKCFNHKECFYNCNTIQKVNDELEIMYQTIAENIRDAYSIDMSGYELYKYADLDKDNGYAPYRQNKIFSRNMAIEFASKMLGKGKEIVMHRRKVTQPMVKAERFQIGFHLFDMWMERVEEGNSISKFFVENGLNQIAIYGMGALGKHLYFELANEGIEVKFAIDRISNNVHYKDIKIYDSNLPSFPYVDVIVVTPMQDYWNIVELLEEKTTVPIVSIEDVITYE